MVGVEAVGFSPVFGEGNRKGLGRPVEFDHARVLASNIAIWGRSRSRCLNKVCSPILSARSLSQRNCGQAGKKEEE